MNTSIPSTSSGASISTSMATAEAGFLFDNTYAQELEGLYAPWHATPVKQPALVKLNTALAVELGLNTDFLESSAGVAVLSGNEVPPGASPLAQAYAGHQFGGYSPQLGDGRALLIGEIVDQRAKRRDIALKGSGRTPFSRRGDGKAALGPVLREYLISESMHALGIPTTRALAAVTTGEAVQRETMLPGAVLTRVASSHIRVGTFQFFANRDDNTVLRRLADYTINRHYPHLQSDADPYLGLLREVSEAQASLVAQWMLVGFIHGVMNTDNVTVSGETIDYGPCAFMDRYDPATVYSSIDQYGRYAYINQPPIAQWNLGRFAEALLPLIDSDSEKSVELALEVVNAYPDRYQHYWLQGMRRKLGLTVEAAEDLTLAQGFLTAMEGQAVDYTQAFRQLSDLVDPSGSSDIAGASDNGAGGLRQLYSNPETLNRWLESWRARIASEPVEPAQRAALMRSVNPVYIPRNHRVEEALTAATELHDFQPFEKLLMVLQQPFETQPAFETYAGPAPAEQSKTYQTFCGT